MAGGTSGVVLDEAFWRSLCGASTTCIDGHVSCIDRWRRVLCSAGTRPAGPQQGTDQGVEALLQPAQRAAAVAAIERAFASGEPQQLELEPPSEEGQRVRWSARVIPFSGPSSEALALLLTAEAHQEPALAPALGAELVRRAIALLPDELAVLDRQRRVVWANRPGPAASALVRKTLDERLTASPAASLAIEAALATGSPGSYELAGTASDGTPSWYAVRVVPLASEGASGHVLLCATDITERRRAEQARAEDDARSRRARHLESAGRLAGGVAHELNNLLQALDVSLSLALEGSRHGEQAPLAIEQAREAVSRGKALTMRLLAVARQSRVAPQRVELGGLVEQLVPALRRAVPGDVTLSYERPPTPLFVDVDPASFEQVLLDACASAAGALPRGGLVQLRAGVEGARVLVSVTDTGPGISPEDLSRLFEPSFTAAQGARSRPSLAIAAGLMAAHGGDLGARSDGRQGTTIELRLPRAAEEPPRAEPPSEGAGVILVAEDEELVRAQVVRILTRAGFTVLQASSGAAAVDVFARNVGAIDLVLLDVVMPELDGWRAYERMVALQPDVKVLFTTGYAAGVLPPDYARHGARLLSKPYKRQQLLAEVRALLARAAPP